MKTLITTILVATLSLVACKKQAEHGSMNVKMTDAPALYAEVNVDVERVEIHYENEGWVTLDTRAGIYNLLDLQNGVTAVIADENQLKTGQVSQMRLILGQRNSIMFNDSTITDLELSSQDKTGLKLNLNAYIEGDHETQILFDFDAEQSIVIEGNGSYKLKPHLKVVSVANIQIR